MDAPLPLLVADLPDEASVARLVALAQRNGDAWVPLVAAPTTAGLHVLELVHPGAAAPVRLAAAPLGPRGPLGTPLRLGLLSGAARTAPAEPPDEVAPVVEVPASDAQTLEGRALADGALVVGALVERAKAHVLHRGHHRDARGHVVVRIVDEELASDPAFRERFLAEAAVAAALPHPNLVRILAWGHEPDGLLWVASEQPEGQTLRQRLTAEGPFGTAKLVPLALQICEALAVAHGAGLVHRDVRPDNVVLTVKIDASVRPVVVAKVREIGFGLGGRLATGRLAVGAPEYMSPEQCRGEELDARSDVYAFGVLLYELVTGQVPFASDKPIVVVNRHLSMPPQPPSELREGVDWRLDALLLRALGKRREERFASMAEMAAEIAALARPSGPRPPKVSSAPPAPMPVVSMPPPASVPAAIGGSIPPVVVIPPPPAVRPEWLEDAGTSHSKFLQGLATGTTRAEDVASAVKRDPKAYAARLAAITEPRDLAHELRGLEAVVRELAAAGDAPALWAVSSALLGIASEGKRTPESRAAVAAQALAWFYEPSLLARLAERRLTTKDAPSHSLLVRAGARGAHALYSARVRLADHEEVRAPFVETLRAIGAAAWPVVSTALARMPDAALAGKHPHGTPLAEDLLASLPPSPDEADADVLVRYLGAGAPQIAEAAARALARCAPMRAGPHLLAHLGDPREGVRIAAIAGLREMGAVDGAVVEKLAPLVRREVPATPALRLAAIAALRAVVEEARAIAAPLLVGVVRSNPRGEDRIVHAAAEALLSMLGNQARAVVLDRMDRSDEPLKSALGALLANPKLEL